MPAGTEAEQLAARYLQEQGLVLVARNYRCRFGEIDLVLRDGTTLVFVEVRQRRRSDFGGAAASIDSHKQQRIVRAARHYLAGLSSLPPCRFDAVLLDSASRIEWIKNAFSA